MKGIVFVIFSVFIQSASCNELTYKYIIDSNHTFTSFEVMHFNTSTVRGRFDKTKGDIFFDINQKIIKTKIVIPISSLNTGIDKFNIHLKSVDFFNEDKYPVIKFTSKKSLFTERKLSKIYGTLEMLGISREIELNTEHFKCSFSKRKQREVCGGDFKTKIERSNWGMTYGLPTIPNEVSLIIQIEAIKNKANSK